MEVGDSISILFLLLSTVMIIVGLVGIFVPVLPGTWLVFAGTLVYAWGTNFQVITIGYLILFAILAGISSAVDYVGSFLTAKKYGASKYGIIASVVLGVLGLLLFSVPGLIIGQLAGIILGELYYGKKMNIAIKSGVAVFVGYILGNVAKIFICSIIVVIFYLKAIRF